MTPQERALRDAWVAEMWATCREVSRGERVTKRENDAVQQALMAAVETRPETVEKGAA
jgi:hypothetical protein